MRLTQGDRDAIVRVVLEAIIEPRRKKLQKVEHQLAQKVLKAALGKHQRAFEAVPKEFKCWAHEVRVNVGGLCFELRHEFKRPSANTMLLVTGPLGDEIRAHMDAGEQLRKDERELRAQVRSVVAAATSAKGLRELWPDGAKYYDKVLAGTPQLPVSVQALQKKIEECRA